MTSFENTFNAPLKTLTLRPSLVNLTSTARSGVAPIISSNVLTSSSTDTLELSPLTAKEALQQSTFASYSPEQVQKRVAESLVTFLDSPVSQVLKTELPEGLKNNPRFALLMSEKAVDYVDMI